MQAKHHTAIKCVSNDANSFFVGGHAHGYPRSGVIANAVGSVLSALALSFMELLCEAAGYDATMILIGLVVVDGASW